MGRGNEEGRFGGKLKLLKGFQLLNHKFSVNPRAYSCLRSFLASILLVPFLGMGYGTVL